MQKKLIALAIAGLSGAAFAQSNVTISGNIDVGYFGSNFQRGTVMDTRTAAASNGSSTSNLVFSGSEALGNGMKANFVATTDWNFGGETFAANAGVGNVFLNSQTYLELEGGFGKIKGGNINTAGLIATMGAQPFATAIGSGISGGFGRLSRAGFNGLQAGASTEGESATAGTTGNRSVRVANSLQYTTPSFSGFTASLQYAVKNNDTNVAATGNTPGFTGIGLAYNNGPINVWYVNEQYRVGTSGSAAAAAAASGTSLTVTGATVAGGTNGGLAGGLNFLSPDEKVTHNILTGNYTFGPATIYAGWTSSKSSNSALADARSWNLAVKYAVSGALSLAANYVRVDDKLTADQDRVVTGLGVDYAMSKRTNLYGRLETGDNDRSAATGSGVGNFNRYQMGVKHTF